ncbi:hypothetical protein D3C73_845700 [compost metagenome]
MYSLELIESNLTTMDRQLLYMIYKEQKETNELLRSLVNVNKQDDTGPDTHISTVELDDIKRPELMKRIARLSNKPQGWNKWETEEMRNFLKGAS